MTMLCDLLHVELLVAFLIQAPHLFSLLVDEAV